MLIVNADDVGASRSATDPALAAYDDGLLTSASAMVWMRDSRRAAELARERGMPLGLHLNLTLPFNGDQVPPGPRALQHELTGEFDAGSWHEDVAPTEDDRRIRAAIAHQLSAFRAVFGEPTHVDGHHHVHVHPAVMACLPRELPVRPVLHSPGQLGKRGPRERTLQRLFRGPDECVSFRHVHPALGGAGMDVLGFARNRVLEVMVHPQLDDERQALHDPEWAEAMASHELGSYRDLAAAAAPRGRRA